MHSVKCWHFSVTHESVMMPVSSRQAENFLTNQVLHVNCSIEVVGHLPMSSYLC